MYKKLKKVRSYFFIATLVACNNSGKESKTGPSDEPRKPHEKPPEGKVCSTKNVERILEDGRTIISRSKSAQSAIVLWDVFSQKVKKNIDFAFKYLDMSTDGEFLVRQISNRRFQVLSIFNDHINYNYSLNYKRGAEPKLDFSFKDNLIASYYKTFSNRYKINIFDVENKDFLFGAYVEDFKFVLVDSLEKVAIIQSSYSKGNRAFFKNLRNGDEYKINLGRGNLSSAILTKNSLLITVNKILHSVSVSSGAINFSKKIKQVFSVDKEEEKALVSYYNGRFGIIDTIDGSEDYSFDSPEGIEISSCHLNDARKSLVCKDSVELDKVKIYRFDLNKSTQVCI